MPLARADLFYSASQNFSRDYNLVFARRRVVWTIAAEAVQRLRPGKRSIEPGDIVPASASLVMTPTNFSIACFAAPSTAANGGLGQFDPMKRRVFY